MTELHQIIWQDFLQKTQTTEQDFSKIHGYLAEGGFEDFCKILFQNWTPFKPSFRLTQTGLAILENMYQSWMFEIGRQGGNTFNIPKVQLYLYRHVQSPYYYDNMWLWLFHSEKAMELTMADGNIRTWVEMFG